MKRLIETLRAVGRMGFLERLGLGFIGLVVVLAITALLLTVNAPQVEFTEADWVGAAIIETDMFVIASGEEWVHYDDFGQPYVRMRFGEETYRVWVVPE